MSIGEKKVSTATANDLEHKVTNFETMRHIETVRNFIGKMITKLLRRAELHDQSKMESPEVEGFTEYTPKLAGCTYGSEEYKGYLEGLKPALDHHYANNRHHPEHWKNGIDDMNILDVLEMLVDWKSATLRHNDGNIKKSIEINAERFNMDHQLTQILMNSVELFEDE